MEPGQDGWFDVPAAGRGSWAVQDLNACGSVRLDGQDPVPARDAPADLEQHPADGLTRRLRRTPAGHNRHKDKQRDPGSDCWHDEATNDWTGDGYQPEIRWLASADKTSSLR